MTLSSGLASSVTGDIDHHGGSKDEYVGTRSPLEGEVCGSQDDQCWFVTKAPMARLRLGVRIEDIVTGKPDGAGVC